MNAAAPAGRPGAIEGSFRTHDGIDLFYRHWPASTTPARGAIVLFHRGHEHSGRLDHLPGEFALPDFDFFAWDSRGHGRSPGARGYAPGFGTWVRDVQTFIDHLGTAHGVAPASIVAVGQSLGAVLVAAWAHDYAPAIRGIVLASPAFRVKLYVPLARPGLRLLQKLRGNFFVTSYVRARFLTRDPQRIASYDTDPLLSRAISVNLLLELDAVADRVVTDAQAITLPTQLLISGDDWVVDHAPQHRYFERLGSAVKEKHVLPGFLHDTLGERERAVAVGLAREFVLRLYAQPPERADLTRAHEHGHTHAEARALARPLPALSPRGLYWRATRAGLRLGGLVSDGLRLGRESGFDSGATLDYVYRNTASGRTLVGRLIDRIYLDSIGWRGIRQRKLHVEELLRQAIERVAADARPVHLVDIAAGHGRYVLDAVAVAERRPDSILLRDYSDDNVRAGAALVAQRGLADVARFVRADAFDRASLGSLAPQPTIAVASGLFELYSDNDVVSGALAGLADAMAPGAALVYTCQPWHPQLELIARALTSHRGGSAWVMRRRTQCEMDQLVERAGFRKVAQRIDRWGIFTVALALRVAG